MEVTREEITNALVAEWDHLCHDDFNEDDMNSAQFRSYCGGLTMEQLLDEAGVTEEFTLEEFVSCWGGV